MDELAHLFKDKVILVTGGTGSFGQRFTDIMLRKYEPKAVRICSRNELKQVEMERGLGKQASRVRFFIGDVRDIRRLYRAMEGVDYVVHAAALKHVPVCEYNPIEAVNTNIDGARNVIDAALDTGVERVIALSTDKAVQPVNLYGATKLVAEKLFVQANAYTGAKRKTRFACVRYGNVLGSSGSVIPLFLQQKDSGEITITDERMTRFWLTLDQGVDFVMKALLRMKGGEIFVPKIPSMKVTDLAEAMAPGVRRRITGMRPGEKLNETLLTGDESKHALEYDDYFIIEPENRSMWNGETHADGKKPADGFSYSSDNNKVWLDKQQLKKILKDQGFGSGQ